MALGVLVVAGGALVLFLVPGGGGAPRTKGPAEEVLVLPPPSAGTAPAPRRPADGNASRPPAPRARSAYVLAPLPPPSGRRVLPVPVGARRDFVSPALSLPPPPSGWYLEVGASASYARARRLLRRFSAAHFQAWISPRATASGAELYRVWVGPYRTRTEVEAMMLRATALSGVAPEIVRHRRAG